MVMRIFVHLDVVDFIEQWRKHLSSGLNLVVPDPVMRDSSLLGDEEVGTNM